MKELLAKIITAILTGQDYRTYVLATINQRFIEKAQELVEEVFEYKYKNAGSSWLERLLEDTYEKRGKESRFKLLWFGGLNDKTVKNMTGGTSQKTICLELGKKNIEALRMLMEEFGRPEEWYQIKIILRKGDLQVELDDVESFFFLNIISAMKLTIQGGAWSEVGKQTEKALLYTIFQLLQIPREHYILVFDEMKRKGLVENREIDAIVFNREEKPIMIELKLLGIGNPEIGDEALARRVGLFLIDRLTDMMKEEAERLGVKVIEFRQENPLEDIYSFLYSKDVPCSPPKKMPVEELEKAIRDIVMKWEEETEKLKLLKKLKEWTQL